VEFGWVAGIPDKVHTEQYFHVKYAPETRSEATGGETVAGKQAIFHRPANSGVYALVCHLELARIGVNDISRERIVSEQDQKVRQRSAIQALMATLIKPTGAQRNTQNPHILGCEGIIAVSRGHLPAPMLSPLNDEYQSEVRAIAKTLNGMNLGTVETFGFASLAAGVEKLNELATSI
jgi:CRISPR-associated protein Cst2